MLCPQCGLTQADELNFCKSCGANLHALRRVLATREQDEKFDWSKSWVAEMFMSSEEVVKRQAEIERLQGTTPEAKRLREIKAGIITGSVGIGLMILLFVLMGGIIASGRVSDASAEILSRIWIVGVIPLFVGVALIINGVFISKRDKDSPGATLSDGPAQLGPEPEVFLPPADTNELFPAGFSVTDETTRHLKEPSKSSVPKN
ncbi:MAG TPA: hypothetical protein VNA17_02415 [Pyrinomonadaceae bacterium]|nr:hypothetical protein [Pyrinomonadaceae bacterium]